VLVDGQDASRAILSAGLACHYRTYDQDPLLESAEQDARSAGRGFWAAGSTRPACAAREALAQSQGNANHPLRTPQGGVIGNTRSRLFHATTCRNSSCVNCIRHFKTQEEAETAGFRPARDCIVRRVRANR
jgi:hypothetical protein